MGPKMRSFSSLLHTYTIFLPILCSNFWGLHSNLTTKILNSFLKEKRKNLSNGSAAKSPFHASNRGTCHIPNPCLPHPTPPKAFFVPDHFDRVRPLVISTERQRVEIFEHASGNVLARFCNPSRAPARLAARFGPIS